MRFGLVGTGAWAEIAHGPGLLHAGQAELAGVWGRDPDKAAALARRLGVDVFTDEAALYEAVDAVAFAVPPDVQAAMAERAALAGKHLLLDKPVALDVEAAHRVAAAVEQTGVASVVYFTDRFVEPIRGWLAELESTGGWHGGWVRWFSALQSEGNPFGSSPWRREHGALWDTGPHALSTLLAALGPVESVVAQTGASDLVALALRHVSGAVSTVTLSQFAPPAASAHEATLWGAGGYSSMPARPGDDDMPRTLATAADELVRCAESGTPHPVDVRFGTRIVELLADAADQIDARSG